MNGGGTDSKQADLAVVGAGIIGLATAHRYIREHPGCRVVVLEASPARDASDRPQLRRAALGDLLPARIIEGRAGGCGPQLDGRVLP
ncbi:FAD-dependent oxidoreductase [Candidatus Poriferisodalis sp.]|uniref:FAD-dependent oxidoreductase n=1 Tax=Candidatus Poriferisodalis sp. TaxID=3101277 RepID=UPI003B019A97